MSQPLLQVALDHTGLDSALSAVALLVEEVDVIEAGTILCYAEGARAVLELRKGYPRHIIVADLKAADAGAVLAEMVFSRGATWMTVICCAPLATMAAAVKIARAHEGDIQVELYGDWTFDQAAEWLRLGLRQVIYHRGRDAQAAGKGWDETDLQKIQRLAKMGFEVSVTGGLNPGDLPQFKDIPVKCFIAGRALYEAADPAAEARLFKSVIARLWTQETGAVERSRK